MLEIKRVPAVPVIVKEKIKYIRLGDAGDNDFALGFKVVRGAPGCPIHAVIGGGGDRNTMACIGGGSGASFDNFSIDELRDFAIALLDMCDQVEAE